jgi:SAM-dependent MidA family methyltransferase
VRRGHVRHRRRARHHRPVRRPGTLRLLSLRDRIHRGGPVRFDVAVDELLYGDDGFFTRGGGAGRGGADFLTSPEVGPLFGMVVARALDAEWDRLGQPDPFVVVEAGAGRGALARAVLDARPACAPALRYVCVERSPALRAAAEELLPVEPAANVFGAVVSGDDEAHVIRGTGPVVAVLDELPLVPVVGVVLANELLDNLPFRLLERTVAGWAEVLVGLDGDRLVEVPVAAPSDAADEATQLAPDAAAGARLPLQHAAAQWVRQAVDLLQRGRVVVIDYADTSPSLASRPWQEWLRTYRGHGRGGGPLDGDQDVTVEVAIDQLRRADLDRAQADWLRAHGVDELVDAARSDWQARAHVGDLEALRHRSRVSEGVTLLDPAGLGAFRVLEWVV